MNETLPALTPERAGPYGLVPTSMSEAMQLANMMASAKLVPAALQKSPADCLMVIQQAVRWQMDPFAVAQECSVIQGKLMHSGKLVAAVVNARGRLAERLRFDYSGAGDNRTITVTGRVDGETEHRTVEVRLKDAKTSNGMWIKQPDQQLMYHGTRVWARRHTPELMLGVYSPEEFEEAERTPRTTLPKKDAREIFDRLQRELNDIAWRGDLTAWQTGSAERIKLLPDDWQDILRLKIEERAAEFRQREAEIAEPVVVTDTLADQPAEGEVIWAEPDETPPEHRDGWSKLTPTQQAGILCNDMVFERFLQEAHHIPEHLVVDFVRNRCLVKSRADIRDNHPSGRLWRDLVAEYRAWQRDETPSAGATQAADPAAPVTSPLPDTEAGAADVIEAETLIRYEVFLTEKLKADGQNGLRTAWSSLPAAVRKDPRMILVKNRLKSTQHATTRHATT